MECIEPNVVDHACLFGVQSDLTSSTLGFSPSVKWTKC